MKSSVIEGMLLEELERNRRIFKRYQEELDKLPKGSIIKRKKNEEIYCYLHYREANKVVSKYIGKMSAIDIIDLEKQIQKRKNIRVIMQKLKVEEKELTRIVERNK